MTAADAVARLTVYSLQLGCVVGAAAAASAIARLRPRRAEYALWRGVLAMCLLLPAQTIAPGMFRHAAADGETAGAIIRFAWTTDVGSHTSLLPLVLLVLLAGGSVARLTWLLIGLVRLHRLRTAGEPAATSVHADLQRRIGTHADVRYVDGLAQPVTFGARAPVVLLPLRLRSAETSLQRAVLCHELLHVRRRDWLWLLAEELVRAVAWFHPAVWWLISRIQRAREELVDSIAIRITNSRRAYMEALLTFGDGGGLTPAPAFGHHHHLVRRITLIATEDQMSTRRALLTSLGVVLAVLFATTYSVRAFPLVQATAANGNTAAEPQPEWAKGAMKLGDKLPMPKVVKKVNPVYSDEAKAAKIQGDVVAQVRIDADGKVRNARIVKSVPMLDEAALDAVKQWEFQPPLLNGKPVPVLADITMRFTLK